MFDINMWNSRYSSDSYAYGKDPNDFLVEASAALQPGKILCLGEGEGRNAVFLAQKGHHVLAVDASEVGLKKAQQLASQRLVSIETHCENLEQFEIKPEFWDGIVSIFCHLPAKIRVPLHQHVVSGLKSGGIFIFESYSHQQLNYKTGGPRQQELLMDLVSLKKEINGLIVKHAVEIERDIHEGQFHNGKSAVVQMIAVKR